MFYGLAGTLLATRGRHAGRDTEGLLVALLNMREKDIEGMAALIDELLKGHESVY